RFIQPVRVVDTRGAPDGPIGFQPGPGCSVISQGKLLDGTVTRFKIAGCTFNSTAIPPDATGLLVNVTLVQAQAAGGFLTVPPAAPPPPPNASPANPATAIAANFWSVGVPTSGPNAGAVAVFSAGDPRDVVIDLVGYFSPSNPATVGNLKFIT